MPESACHLRNEHGDEFGDRLGDTDSSGAIIVVLSDANLEEDKDCCVAGSGWSRCSYECHPLGIDCWFLEYGQNSGWHDIQDAWVSVKIDEFINPRV